MHYMRSLHLIIVRSVIAGITILCLFTSIQLFVRTGTVWLDANDLDDVSRFQQRFIGAQDALPRGQIIGYLTEASPEEVSNNGSLEAEYILTQYALSPIVVANDPRRAWVLGNFHTPMPRYPGNYGRFSIIKDCGTGVIVLRNEDTRL